MKPYEERTPDTQYREVLRYILKNGVRVPSQSGTDALTAVSPPPHMVFNLENGAPVITERKMYFWRQPIGEMFAFVNGARTLQELEAFGCKYWSAWATPEKCAKRGLLAGDLGPGSYGAAFHDFPMPDGGTFNQFQHIVEQIRELPHLRTHRITPYIPYYLGRGTGKQQKVVVAPCHGNIHVEIIKQRLVLRMRQDSADCVIGVPSDMVMYAALTLALAQVLGYKEATYVHSFSDAHIYANHVHHAEEMLAREPRRFLPTLSLTEEGRGIQSIFDFRHTHFALTDYRPYPPIVDIPIAI